MRAVLLHDFTTSTPRDVLRMAELPAPEIQAQDDVVIRIAGAGVCRSDLHILEGMPIGGAPVPLPHLLGHENAGFVEAVGSGVTTVGIGDPILCYPFLTTGLALEARYGLEHHVAERSTPGINCDGGYAEFLRVNERSVVKLPEGSDPAEFAPLTDAGLAAYRACKEVASKLRPDQTVVVVGAGGLGHLGLQILKALGPARVVVVDPKPEALALAQDLGADEVHESMESVARPVAAVVDFVGSDTTVEASVTALGSGGRLSLVGIGGNVQVPTQKLVESELTISGSLVGSYVELLELTQLAVTGRVKSVISRYPLDDAERALTDLREGRVLGRAVLIP